MTDATEKIIEKIEEIIRDPSHSSSRAKAEAIWNNVRELQIPQWGFSWKAYSVDISEYVQNPTPKQETK